MDLIMVWAYYKVQLIYWF